MDDMSPVARRPRGRAHRSRPALLVAIVAPSLMLSGCGVIITQGPPANHTELTSITCTESDKAPAFDVIFGGIMVLGAVLSATRDHDPVAERDDAWLLRKDQITATYATVAAGSGISAYLGFRKTAGCREARRALAERLGPGR